MSIRLSASLFFVSLSAMLATDSALTPPKAKAVPKKIELHGDVRNDDYFWLREKTDPEVIAYLEAENRYTEAVMKPTEGLQKRLYDEILARIKQTDLSVPSPRDRFRYYNRTQEGKQYQIFCRKPVDGDAEQVLLDQNELAREQKYFRVGVLMPSPDENILAYSTDTQGDEEYTVFFKKLDTGEVLPDRVKKTYYGFAWASDNRTVFYTVLDAAKRPYQLWRHTIGQEKDDLVYEEKDERFTISISRSRSGRFLWMSLGSAVTSETRYLPADQPKSEFRVFAPRKQGVEYNVTDQGDSFYVWSNENAKNYRLVRAPISDPAPTKWKEVLAHRPAVKLEGVENFAHHLVIYERENGLRRMRIRDQQSGKEHYIEFPEPAYTVFPGQNHVYNTSRIRFSYMSLVTPQSVFEYDLNKRTRELLKRDEVLGGYDPNQYVSERVFATASDGAKVPVALVYKKGFKRNGSAPLYLYGYGSYGANSDPFFASSRLSLLDRGFVYAIANIRGGSEMGEQWHDDGKLLKKRNTFTDFIACAEYLVANKYTSKERLVAMGGSAGGLLMGAVVNLRPDLFKAIVAKVPFVDVLNTMMDTSLPLTVGEYEEWGNINDKAAYEYMKTYSPYDNVTAKAYPNLLITAGLNDPRVSYWEPAKWTAKLRAVKTDKNLLLLKTNMGAGHFGASGRYEQIKETAFEFAFLFQVLGIKE